MKYIASVSFGKDSLAMLLKLLSLNENCRSEEYPLDEVVFYDTGKEFQAIYNLRDKIKPLLESKGVRFIQLDPPLPFDYKMFDKPVCKRGTKEIHKHGYSWCGGTCRWGTTDKLTAIEKYCKGHHEYVGLAADEPQRLAKVRKGNKSFPLNEWGMTENDCLTYCYAQGYDWLEEVAESIAPSGNVIDLYELLDRVSCWCCRNKNLKELKNIYHYFKHSYWEMLKEMQSKLAEPMKKSGSVFELEKRFEKELMKKSL